MFLPQPTGEFTPLEVGTHLALCYEVLDFGTQTDTYEGVTEIKRKIWISWETSDQLMSDGRPFTIGREYNLSMNSKSKLRIDLEAWRGKKFVESDFGPGGFNLSNILGKACGLSVVHSNTGKARVGQVVQLMKGTEVPEPFNETRYLSLEPEKFNQTVFDSLADWKKERIAGSPEYAALAGPKRITVPDIDTTDDNETPF